jgi:hypothetical protein
MVTGEAPFRGTAGEVMYQHQRGPLPLEQLKDVPQPLVVLLEVLLEKDPGRRFQNPAELLKAIPRVMDSIDEERKITHESLQKMPAGDSCLVTHKPPTRPRPEKISVSRWPITGSDVFGPEEDLAFLNDAWANQHINIVTIVAWAGVGKSTLVNHWLGRMAAEHYRSAELVFGWSFYRQGSTGGTSSADEFLDVTLAWFGDPDPRIGTAWEKGERLAKFMAYRRTLLVLDGLEPLQNPPGPQEGRLREPSLPALLRELAAFNTGLCVITTRLPVADIADHERTSALRRDLEQLTSDAGANLLRALGVKGHEAELRSASDEFSGHSLALTLLGSYLSDAYSGDIRSRQEVSARLAHDVRQGVHARKVMESYQTWFGEGPELSVLRILGLFDRPADEKAVGALLKPPPIRGLTESLTDLSPTDWRTTLARLRREKLLAALAVSLYFLGDFDAARQYARQGVQIWRAGGLESQVQEITEYAVGCLFFSALLEWHFGEIASCQPTMTEAISVAKELNNMQALAYALWHAGWLAHFERNPAEVERLASELIELSNRQNFAPFLRRAAVLRGWARSASADAAQGIAWIKEGTFLLALKAGNNRGGSTDRKI